MVSLSAFRNGFWMSITHFIAYLVKTAVNIRNFQEVTLLPPMEFGLT